MWVLWGGRGKKRNNESSERMYGTWCFRKGGYFESDH